MKWLVLLIVLGPILLGYLCFVTWQRNRDDEPAKEEIQAREEPIEARRQLKPLEKKSLQALDLSGNASRDEIKTRFKELVKLHHPDANGGDKRSGDKLREIIQAYNYLKQVGLA